MMVTTMTTTTATQTTMAAANDNIDNDDDYDNDKNNNNKGNNDDDFASRWARELQISLAWTYSLLVPNLDFVANITGATVSCEVKDFMISSKPNQKTSTSYFLPQWVNTTMEVTSISPQYLYAGRTAIEEIPTRKSILISVANFYLGWLDT